MQVIVLKNEDNTVSIITPAESTIDSIIDALPADSEHGIAKAQDVIDISDNDFLEARVFSTKYPYVEVDLTKAKDIWRDKLRKARKPILEQLDVEFMKALESSDSSTIKEIKEKKQELRDITQHSTLKSAKSLDKIKSFWPAILS